MAKKYFEIWRSEAILGAYRQNRNQSISRSFFEKWRKFHSEQKRKEINAEDFYRKSKNRKLQNCFKKWQILSRTTSEAKLYHEKLQKMAEEFRREKIRNNIIKKLLSVNEFKKEEKNRLNDLIFKRSMEIKSLKIRPFCKIWREKYHQPGL